MVAEKDRQLFHVFAAIETTNIAFIVAHPVLAFISNTFLIFVIMKSTKDLHSYSYLLLAFAINDIWFPLVHLLTLPVICSYRDAFIMFSNGIFTSKFSICVFAAVFSQTMPIMAHLFIYRLIVLKWPAAASFYTGLKTALLISTTVLLQLSQWFANCWFNYNSDDEMKAYNERGLRFSAVMATMGFNSIMAFWSIIIMICAVLIVKSFKISGGEMGQRTQYLQKQMFKTLVLQMIVLIVCVYLPCAGIINFPMFFRISVFPNFVSASLTLFPIIDAVITLVGVRIFRGKIMAMLQRSINYKIRRNRNISTTIAVQ